MHKLKTLKKIKLALAALLALFGLSLAYAPLASAATTFRCYKDVDYPAAGFTDIPGGESSDCQNQASYSFTGSSQSPTMTYTLSSSSGASTTISVLSLQDAGNDPLVWIGKASYDKHEIKITIAKNAFTDPASAKRYDKGTFSKEVQIPLTDAIKKFAGNNNVPVISTISPTQDPARSCTSDTGCTDTILTKYIHPIINLLSAAVGVVVVIMFIIGGIQFSTAGGDPNKVVAAKKKLYNAGLALLAYIFAYAFLQWIVPGGLFG